MDALKGFASKLGGDKQQQQQHETPNTTTGTTSTGTGATGNTAGGQDYGDKAFAAAGKKFGFNQSAENNERITDGMRGAFEKATGKKVPEKYSN